MISIDELVVLEPALLRDGIHLRENEICAERLALALLRSRAVTRNYVLQHIDAELATAVRSMLEGAVHAGPETILRRRIGPDCHLLLAHCLSQVSGGV